MSNTRPIAARLQDAADRHNREVKLEVWGKVLLGVGFSFLVFGFVFWFGWVAACILGHPLDLEAWQFGALVTGLFFIVATWSAWQRVDPLSGLQPLSDGQRLLTLISQATPGLIYFSPRHASAGAAVVLLGGPLNVLEGLGIWVCRLRADPVLIEEAARLLAACREPYPVEEVREPAAALLLLRLKLIKAAPSGESAVVLLTEKGEKMLPRKKAHRRKEPNDPREFHENEE